MAPSIARADFTSQSKKDRPMSRRTLAVAAGAAAFLIVVVTFLWPEPRGAKLFRRERCYECHTIAGAGGGAGPDLSAVGSRRSKEYITAQIRNPKSHNPDSNMPSFGHLPQKDIEDLAAYLSGLR
jgi:mono/diheme cytochrome c family protein